MHLAEHGQHLHLEDHLALLSALVGSKRPLSGSKFVELTRYSTYCYTVLQVAELGQHLHLEDQLALLSANYSP